MKTKLLLILAAAFFSLDAMAHAQVLAKSTNFSIFKGNYVIAKADYIATIQNNTLLPKNYTVIATLCPENKQCKEISYIANVASGGFYDKKFNIEYGITYRGTGSFRLLSTIRIVGESNAFHQDYGTITVYDKPN